MIFDRTKMIEALRLVVQRMHYSLEVMLLLRPCEVLSRVADGLILKVTHNSRRVLLQHRHVLVSRLA